MKLVERRKQGMEEKIFSGKVSVTIQGVAYNGKKMSKASGMPSLSFTLSDVRVEEVNNMVKEVADKE